MLHTIRGRRRFELSFAMGALIAVPACAAATPSAVAVAAPEPIDVAPQAPSTLAARAISIGEHGTITSQVLGEEREFLVYTPASYADSDQTFPVLYLLDGEAHFHHVTGIVAFLEDLDRIPPMLVVGVVNTERSRDLTPSHVDTVPNSGGAEPFVRFIETELIPAVDANYRTHSYRIIVGHSYGGLLAAHLIIERPELFNAYLAISPTFDWDDDLMLRRAKQRWQAGQALDRFLYFTVGDEPESITQSNNEFAAFLRASAPPGLSWSFELMDDEDHRSTPHRTVYAGLNRLFVDWQLPADLQDAAAIAAHYQAVSERFGFQVRPPRNALHLLGYRVLGEGRSEQAVAIFRLFITSYPDSANGYDSLAEALEQAGEFAQALANYELAVEHGTAQQHQLLDVFVRNRDRLRTQLGESTR